MKYLLWALLLYLGWRWYLSKKAQADTAAQGDSADRAQTAQATPTPEAPSPTEKMVACAHCGVHLPLSESVRGSGVLHYCSDEHRLQHSGS